MDVVPGKLKLKKGSGGIKKKMKDKSKVSVATVRSTKIETFIDETPSPASGSKKTAAELAFQRRQTQIQIDRVMWKAQKSHKDRVEEYNRQLDSMTEFNDIPKVSWTK